MGNQKTAGSFQQKLLARQTSQCDDKFLILQQPDSYSQARVCRPKIPIDGRGLLSADRGRDFLVTNGVRATSVPEFPLGLGFAKFANHGACGLVGRAPNGDWKMLKIDFEDLDDAAMLSEEKKMEVDHIKTLIFYSERAAKETRMDVMVEQTNRLKEFLKLIGVKK